MTVAATPYRCLWADGKPTATRSSLPGNHVADVCIVGAGFTGLWTAWHLLRLDPSLRVVVIEANHVGYGASGRNGGWVQTALPSSLVEIGRSHGSAMALRVHTAMAESVSMIHRFATTYAPDAGFSHAGHLHVARSPAQSERLRAWVADHHRLGMSDSDFQWLEPSQVREMVGVTNIRGGYFTPHCAVVNPRRLVDGLATACESLGVHIFEQTKARSVAEQRVETDAGLIRAPFVLRATEGYTSNLASSRRDLLPIFSMMIATEPLREEQWEQIGWRDRFTFSDGRHLVIYGQRTDDDRIAFGGRGAPYRFGSKTDDFYADNIGAHRRLQEALVELFPVLSTVAITHRWGGPLGVSRDWEAGVGLDRSTGLAWAGGYVGDGVGAAHLAGQTLADLILGYDTDRTTLPWVGHRSRKWEPEPFRSIGVRTVARLTATVDEVESKGSVPRLRARVLKFLR